MPKKYTFFIISAIIVIALLVVIIILLVNRHNNNSPEAQTTKSTVPGTTTVSLPSEKPATPSNLTATYTTSHVVELKWQDNSQNEDGFKVFRDDILIASLEPETSIYQDTSTKPANVYNYSVLAYNANGESGNTNYQFKTPNPSIIIRLDKIGVYDNREDLVRGKDGEVYVYAVVYDWKNPQIKERFPIAADQHYKLEKNEVVDVNAIIFSVNEVGDNLGLTILGYEDDGGGFEPVVSEVLGKAIESQLSLPAWGLMKAFDIEMDDLIGKFTGQADDSLGSYEHNWGKEDNWGTGSYADIACVDERGVECLRVWFTISTN